MSEAVSSIIAQSWPWGSQIENQKGLLVQHLLSLLNPRMIIEI